MQQKKSEVKDQKDEKKVILPSIKNGHLSQEYSRLDEKINKDLDTNDISTKYRARQINY